MEITKEDFEAYVKVQKSGITNMWAVTDVAGLTGLTKEQVQEIMKTYRELSEKFPILELD